VKSIQILKKLSRDGPAELYYAGEYARDMLRRKKSGRIEVVIRNLPFQKIFGYLKKHFNNIYVAKNGSFLSFLADHSEITIKLPQKGGKHSPHFTLRDDSRSRGFTINAMYIPITSRKKGNVIDFYRGRNSIKGRKIKTIGRAENAIKRDPLLMIKAIALSSKINYRIDNNLFYAIKANSELLEKVSVEEIRDAFVEIILSNKPSRYLKVMNDSNILSQIIPELSICSGMNQNKKYHKYDVFDHCLAACDNVEPNLVLRLAALFHDIGKAQTREEVMRGGTSKVTFYNHEVVGSKVSKKIMRRLRFDREISTEVSDLVYNHMYNYEPNIWTDAAVRRFIKKVQISGSDLEDLDNMPLFLLRKADRAANGLNLSEISPRQYDLQDRIKQVYTQSKALHITDLDIDGATIMEYFKLKPGPTVGHVLNYLLSVVIEDQTLNTKQKLIEEASKYLSEALK
jgi:poly(A) polymerase/tRNA nucleotidyltransferase (CCA-adding enzyme)